MLDDQALLDPAFNAATPRQRVGLIREFANRRATGLFDELRAGPDWRPQPPRRVPELAGAVLFLMVKDEAEIIGQNLRHHYALGFRRFFILDNGSTDQTAAIIAGFRAGHPDAGVFSAYDYIVGHYQAKKMQALVAFMQAYLHYEADQPDWLFFVDADEFITFASGAGGEGERRFGDMLADPSKSLLVFHWAQCASDRVLDALPAGEDLPAALPVVWPRMKVAVTKVAYRLNHGLEPIQGNHLVEEFPYSASQVAIMAEADFYLFHYPVRTVEQLRRKVVNGNRALLATADRDGLSGTATHWRTYHQWYEQAGDVALRQVIEEHIDGCLNG